MSKGLVSCCLLLVLCAGGLMLTGCGSAQKTKPHLVFGTLDVQAKLDRDDVVVLDRMEGRSETFTCCFGLVRVVDGDKLQLFGIKFFKDKYTYFRNSGSGLDILDQTADRAYYAALEKQDEADAVFVKSWDYQEEGLPLVWHTQTVTLKGRAVKLKSDQK